MSKPAGLELNAAAAAGAASEHEPDDLLLVARVRRGDERAVRAIIARNNQRLFRAARSVVRNDAEAEDVVQETYVRAFTRLDTFRAEASLSTWLTRIALNDALGRVRKRRDAIPIDDFVMSESEGFASSLQMQAPPENPETGTARLEMRRILESVVDRLPDPFRIVLVLRDIEGLSTEETAGQLSIRPETVKTRLHRARKLVRAEVEERTKASFAELFPFAGVRCAEVADRVVGRLRGARSTPNGHAAPSRQRH